MKKWKIQVLNMLLFVFVAIMIVNLYVSGVRKNSTVYHRVFNEGWTVKLNNGTIYENVNLDNLHLPVTNSGSQIVLTNTLPDDLEDDRTMLVYMVHSVVDVYIDGEKVYTHGREEFKDGKMIGFGNEFVTIPRESAGKEIKIYIFVTEDNAFSTISAPVFYNEATIYKDYLWEKRLPLVVAVSLIVIGGCITVVTFFSFFKSYSMDKLFCIGVFSLSIGCWSLSNYNLAFLFTDSLGAKSSLEYMALYMILLPLLFYFRVDVLERSVKWEMFTYYTLVLVEIQILVISLITHFFDIVHFPAYVRIYQIFMIVAGLFIIYLLIMDMKEKRSHKILIWGFAGILLIALRDLVVFNITKYTTSGGVEGQYKSYIAVAALLFVVTLFIDFLYEMRKRLYTSAQTDLYVKLAYYDVLTDLYTRRKCDEIFAELDKKSDSKYSLIMFDLNNLKVTNDIYGHEEGDKLILRFADILRNTFNDGEALIRMGGDEFLAIINNCDIDTIKKKLAEMDANIVKANSEYAKVRISVSYGFCTSEEVETCETRHVYKFADKRMYEQKEQYYKINGMNRRRFDNKQ